MNGGPDMKRCCLLLLLLACLAGCRTTESVPKANPAPAETPAPAEKPAPAPAAPETAPADAPEADACTYTVRVEDADGSPVAGVMVNFCTDVSCTPITTDDEGRAVFTGPPEEYHVQVIRVPKGWQVRGEAEFHTEPREQSFRVILEEAEP